MQVFLGLTLAVQKLAKAATSVAHANKERVITSHHITEAGKVPARNRPHNH